MKAPARPPVRRTKNWSFPQPREHQLDNGLQVLLIHRPGQHVISIGLSLDIPLTAEPRAVEGVAGVCASALDEGTARYPGRAFAEAVENCGAVLTGAAQQSATSLYLDVPDGGVRQGLHLLAEAVSRPELADDAVDRMRGVRLAQIKQQLATSAERANHALRRTLIQRKYRAARMAGGEVSSLDTLTPADVRAFHSGYYGPQGATLLVSGDFDQTIPGDIADAFGDWTNPNQRFAEHEAPQPRRRHLYLIDRPGSVQADVRLGRFTIDRTAPEWADFQVATHVLGGAFLSRLNRVLREERGLTYGVHLVNAPMREGGYSYVQGSFRNDVVAEAVDTMPGLIDVSDAPLTAQEVDASRTYLSGIQPLQFQTAAGVTSIVMNLLAAGLRPGYVDALRAAYERVTPASATDAVARLLPPHDPSLVVVGDADLLADPLTGAGWQVRTLRVGEWI